MPTRKQTSTKPTLGSMIMNLPLQTIGSKIVYVALLLAFLIIGYLFAKVEALKSPTQQTTQQAVVPSTAPQAQAAPVVTLDQVKNVFNKSVIKFGKSDAKHIIVEAADPSCPYCHAAAGKDPELSKQMGPQFTTVAEGGSYVPPVPEIKKLLDQGKLSYSYVYVPGHGNGEMGMRAFYCAFENGKFWEVHDLLMNNAGYTLLNETIKNDKTKSQELADFLSTAIDPTTMKACLDSGKYDTKLTDDTTLANGIGASGTPTYYINATQKVGALSFTEFEPLLK